MIDPEALAFLGYFNCLCIHWGKIFEIQNVLENYWTRLRLLQLFLMTRLAGVGLSLFTDKEDEVSPWTSADVEIPPLYYSYGLYQDTALNTQK